MNAAVRCPRCGAAIELPIGLGPRYVHDAGGASYVTATVRCVCVWIGERWQDPARLPDAARTVDGGR